MRSTTRLLLLAALWLPTLAFAGGPPWPGPNNPPGYVAARMAPFWRQLATHVEGEVKAMVDTHAEELGYKHSDYTTGDMACMLWWSAWAQVASGARRMPQLGIPQGFIDELDKAAKAACFDDDDKGPGAPTGRGWNTIRRATLGRTDVQRAGLLRPLTAQEKDVALSAAKWVAAGAAVLLSVPSLALP